jgi:hypothetical protein
LEHVNRDALTQLNKPQEKVFGSYEIMVEPIRLLACQGENLLSPGSEVVHGIVAHIVFNKYIMTASCPAVRV